MQDLEPADRYFIHLRSADAVASLDVLLSLVRLADQGGYVRPQVDEGEVISISDGRHPVIDALELGERFVPNDVYLDNGDNQLLIITGPNMAGKSTYIRQVALLVIMNALVISVTERTAQAASSSAPTSRARRGRAPPRVSSSRAAPPA